MTPTDQVRHDVVGPTPERRVGRKVRRWALLLAVVGPLAAIGASRTSSFWNRSDRLSQVARRVVHRADLGTVLTASGLTESGSNTIIACQLERLDFSAGQGNAIASGGAAAILEVLPEGTMVKKDQILCRLDSSEYEELVRQQQIRTEQARATYLQAKLDFEVAELAVREYTDGLLKQTLTNLEGQVVFSESTLERAVDRLAWTKRMLGKGYASIAQCATAERAVEQAKQTLLITQWDLDLFKRFGNPKSLKSLNATVEKCRFNMISNERRVDRFEERLAHYQKMVDFCTIRAPHDGFLIYATDYNRSSNQRIEAGEFVRQGQKLFFLPDLENMTVKAYLHESVAQRVREGLAVRARIEGLGGRLMQGHVVSVAPLPVAAMVGWMASNDVKYFIGTIKLDEMDEKLRPGMTALVEIDVDRRDDVLAIPSEALALVDGKEVCYVAVEDGVEARPVTIGQTTTDLLEVTSGLNEGEEVVMQPDLVSSLVSTAAEPSDDVPSSSSPDDLGAPESASVE